MKHLGTVDLTVETCYLIGKKELLEFLKNVFLPVRGIYRTVLLVVVVVVAS